MRTNPHRMYSLLIAVALFVVAPAEAQSPGADFVNSITQIEGNALGIVSTNPPPPEEQGRRAWDDAKNLTRALCACNDVQRQYQQLSLEYQTWQDEFQTCYYTIYVFLGTPGGPSVGEWLDCITPVNAGLIGTRSARSGIEFEARRAPCDAGASCASGASDAVISAEVFQRTRDLVRLYRKFSLPRLKKKIQRGINFLVNPQSDGTASVVLQAFRLNRGADRQSTDTHFKVAEGIAQSGITLPANIEIRAVPGGVKHITNPRTKKLGVTITFTRASDGIIFSSTKKFSPPKE